ncbi:hypothetical protein [Reyranella sp.]|uniref:hypothetical protein n=1 Tax=Reyranella sp. TaxID=1929291 RepID=UPI003784ACF2
MSRRRVDRLARDPARAAEADRVARLDAAVGGDEGIVAWHEVGEEGAEEVRPAEGEPDTFLSGIYDEAPDLMTGSLANARRNLTQSRVSPSAFIDILRNQQLAELAKRTQRHVGDL